MRRLCIHKNIPVSETKRTIGLRVGFISFHLTADKSFPVNPRAITGPPKMSLLFEAQSMPALVIKPRLIFVAHTDDLGWNKTSNQQQQMLIQYLNRIANRPNVTSGQILHCTTNCIPIWCFWKTFLLTHKFETAWAIEMTADRQEWSALRMGATTATHSRSGTSVIRRTSVPPFAWVGPTTNWSQPDTVAKSKAATPWQFVVVDQTTPDGGHSNHPQTGKRHAHAHSAQQPLMLVNSQKSGHQVRVAVKSENIKVLSAPQTLKNSISQQPHSNLGWQNAPYPSRTYAAIPRAWGVLPRHNKTRRPNPETCNYDTWRISESKVTTPCHTEMTPRSGH